MYVVRSELVVTPGRTAEFEERATELGQLRKRLVPGSGQTLLRSYGRPGVYTIVGRFPQVEDFWSFSNSKEYSELVGGGATGLYSLSRPQEGYEAVLEVNVEPVPSQLDCELLVDWTVALPQAAAFEASRRELFELRKKHQVGFVSNRLRRNAGLRDKYLIIQIAQNLEAARAAVAPEVAAYGQANPASKYGGSFAGEAYRVVHRI